MEVSQLLFAKTTICHTCHLFHNTILPIASMYGCFAYIFAIKCRYIYHNYMDGMGYEIIMLELHCFLNAALPDVVILHVRCSSDTLYHQCPSLAASARPLLVAKNMR